MAIKRASGDVETVTEGVTTVIPAAMLGGQSVGPGDVVQLEVVSVDADSGDVTARYAMPEEEIGGIDEMAAQFNVKG